MLIGPLVVDSLKVASKVGTIPLLSRPKQPITFFSTSFEAYGGPIAMATDVYSACVVLYRLLTGMLPHDLAGCSAAGAHRNQRNGARSVLAWAC